MKFVILFYKVNVGEKNMKILSIILVAFGACIMAYSIFQYYRSLLQLKIQIKAKKLFSDYIYAACFIMMLFFLVGYVVVGISYLVNEDTNPADFLIALIFFFGAIFVFAMVKMVQRMFIVTTDKAELKRQLKQQELMSDISQSFTSIRDHGELICDALKKSGEFLKVNRAFLLVYKKDTAVLECLYEWHDDKSVPFINNEKEWQFTEDMEVFKS